MPTPSGSDGRRSLALAALTALLALACTGGDDPDDNGIRILPIVFPTISAPEPAFQRVRPGGTAIAEWTVTWPGGERPDYVAFHVNSTGSSLEGAAEVRGGWVEGRTRYRMEITTERRGPHELVFWPMACASTSCEPVPGFEPARVQVAGGPADAVFPPVTEAALAVGEARPMTAYAATALVPYEANPNTSFGERFWSDDPLSFTTDDPSVASVSADGLLVGESPGSTVLRIAAGPAEAQVALTVLDVPLGPPPVGAFPVTEHQVELYQPGWAAGAGPLESKVAVDGEGWPMVVVPLRPGFGPAVTDRFYTQLPPLALARWTGTGFGYEWVGEPSERNFYGAVSVGDDDHVWLLVRDRLFNHLELWDRPGHEVAGGWSKRRLPVGVDVGDGELDASWFSEGYNNGGFDDYFPVATLPRAEGGVWLAYATWQDARNPYAADPWSEQCPRMIRLVAADADADGVEIELVERTWTLTVQSQGGCRHRFDFGGAGYLRLVLLPASFGSPFPTVIGLLESPDFGDNGNVATWRWTPDAWVRHTSELDHRDLAPILPVSSTSDWLTDDEALSPLWAWRDLDGGLHVRDSPIADVEEQYGGHAVDGERLYVFGAQNPGAFAGSFWLYTSFLP